MLDPDFPLQLVRCPRCAGELAVADDLLRCDTCGHGHPVLAGIPCLLARPRDVLANWCARLGEFVASNEDTRTRLLADIATLPASSPSRARLGTLQRRLGEHRDRVVAVLAPLGVTPSPRTSAEPSGVPGEGSITAYYHQIHRDWGWDAEGSDENVRAFELVRDAIGERPLGTTIVLGAGACRLPSDLHRACGATTTVALDIAPLPMAIGRRVLAGERVPMFEFPLTPPDAEHVCVERVLAASPPGLHGFHQVFADALDPPCPTGVFDSVITPWFIDQVPRDLATLLPTIAGLLRPGGRWINHGPLIYHPNHTAIVHRYARDEVRVLIRAAGFSITHERVDRLPFMQSPACTQGRTESVWTFVAERGETQVPTASRPGDEPGWLRDPDAAIPRWSGLDGYAPPHPLFARVLELLDDRRTAREIAEVLITRHKVPAHAALVGVQTCLVEMWRATNA